MVSANIHAKKPNVSYSRSRLALMVRLSPAFRALVRAFFDLRLPFRRMALVFLQPLMESCSIFPPAPRGDQRNLGMNFSREHRSVTKRTKPIYKLSRRFTQRSRVNERIGCNLQHAIFMRAPSLHRVGHRNDSAGLRHPQTWTHHSLDGLWPRRLRRFKICRHSESEG